MKTETAPKKQPDKQKPLFHPVLRILRSLLVPFLALVVGLAVGGIVMVFSDPDTLRAWASFLRNPGRALSESWELVYTAYSALFERSLGSTNAISETVVAATPLILAGLAVALAFKAGLFNIGAEGQLLMGAVAASFVGFTLDDWPALVLLPAALIGGALGGALWGFVPGFLKAKTGAHEVIVTIMMNFIAFRLTDYLLSTDTFRRSGRTDPITKVVGEGARLPRLFGDNYRLHAGIILALLVTYGVWWLLFRSTVGFTFRAVGANPNAAHYAGMSVGGTFIISMTLAGGLAGLGGTSQLLGVQMSVFPGFSSGYGFDAIALALLGRTNPFGVVAAALLFGVLRAGAVGMQAATSVPVDIIVVIQALVIVFVAAPDLVREIFRIREERGVEEETLTKTWAA
jgi:ABC-type uncharacterized transport system permease subunit